MAKVRSVSIFKKTSLLAVFLFGVISMLTSALTAYTLYERMTQEYLSKGTAIAQSISGASQEILFNRDAATVQAMIDQYLDIEGVAYVFVIDDEKVVISHTFVPEMPQRLVALHKRDDGRTITELSIEPFGRVIDISEPILAGVAGYVHVGMDKELIMQFFWESVFKMQSLLFVIFLVCVVILAYVTRKISQPLTRLTDYAAKIAAHDFSAQIDVKSSDEVGALARSMQSMAMELAILFAEMESEVAKATGNLREHMAYLSAIINNLADGLLVISPNGNISMINPVMRDLFDLGDVDYVGVPLEEVFPEEVVSLSMAIGAGKIDELSGEIPLTRERTGKGAGSSIDGPDDVFLGGVILIRDITREKELDQLKTDFISTVSHELRTPMTSVLGFSKIIKKKLNKTIFPALNKDEIGDVPVTQVQENMDIIVTEAERLTELINDVLDIAKMEAGGIQWKDQDVAMADVLRQSVDSTRGLWKAKDIEVVTKIEDDLPIVRGDRARLVQVMVNLISNAVKFTEVGPVVCHAHSDGRMVLVSVVDNGIGIEEQYLDDVFDKFKQAGDTLTDKPTGTGLGLPICRQIIEYHGGRIWAESEMGKGSTFSFNLPVGVPRNEEGTDRDECQRVMPKPDSTMLVRSPSEPIDDPLILVVDDDHAMGRYLTQIFEDQNFRVRRAINGEEAIELASDLMPNLITMDLMMPGMDGKTAIKCLRNNPFTRHIPILVLSALSDQGVTGVDFELTKPVDDVRLVETIRSLLVEKDIRHSCMVLGDLGNQELDDLTIICPENISFCDPEDIWLHIEKGFEGTIFIPAELDERLDMARLVAVENVTVVILPVLPGTGKSI